MKKKISYLIIFLSLFILTGKIDAKALILETDSRCEGFSIKYQTMDGNSVKEKFIKLNDYYTNLDVPTRSGYRFAGWYYDYNLTQRVYDSRAINLSDTYKVKSNTTCPVVTLYAKWEINQDTRYQNCNNGFRINYHYNNPLQNDDNLFVSNNGIFGLNAPTRDGYTFGGWYYDYNLTNPVYAKYEKDLDERYMVQGFDGCLNAHIYAKWIPNVRTEDSCGGFTVRYETLDNLPVQEVFIKSNDYYTNLDNPTRNGYDFAGWYYDIYLTKKVTDTRAIYLQDAYKVKSSNACPKITLYAKWVKWTNPSEKMEEFCGGFNIRYNYLNGSNSKDAFIKLTDNITILETPTRNGYTFAGWYYDSNYYSKANVGLAKRLSSSYKVQTGNNCPIINLYAKWEKIVTPTYPTAQTCEGFTLKYDKLDGQSIKEVFIKSNDNVTFLDEVGKGGYKFLGWYYDKNLTQKVNVEKASMLSNSYKVQTGSNCPTITLYAKWEKIDTPTYQTEESCGGFGLRYQTLDEKAVKETFIKTNDYYTNIETPTRSGYNFLGWYYDINLTKPVNETKAGNLSDSYKIKSTGSCPVVNIYAKWEKINNPTYQTEESCGGFGLRYQTLDEKAVKEVFIGLNDYNTNIETPIRNGYNFLGWYYDINLTQKVDVTVARYLSDSYKIKSTGSCPVVNIYAKWEKQQNSTIYEIPNCGGFNVRYYTNDGNYPTNTFVKYNTVTNLYNPIREGFTFDGWYYDEALLNPVNTDKAIYLSNNYMITNDSVCPYINLHAKWLRKYDLNNAAVSIPESMTSTVVNIEIKKYDDPNEISNLKSFDELNKVKYSVYEIDLYDESQNKVQPDGMVRIEFDIPANLKNTKLIVYRLEGNKLIPYNVRIVNNKATIDTNHFSTYILAEKSEASNSGVNKVLVGIGLVAFLVGLKFLLIKISNKIA